jgi:hypothetical protein
VRDVGVPTVESNRNLPGYQAKLAIIFSDNCSRHCSDDILQESASHGILWITYLPRTSYIFQLLDVMLFGRLKSAKKYLPRYQELDPHVDHIIRVFLAYEIATTSTTIRGSWERVGFWFIKRNDTYYLWVNEDKIRGSREFQEVW